jgi:transposase
MRGADTFTEGLFTLKKLDDFVPANHPLRVIRTMVNKALAEMGELFAGMYEEDAKGGRPSIAPEKLLRAMLLQVLYSIRSERQLMEQTQYNLLFRWFIGLSMDDSVWVPTVFTKNRERLIEHDAVVAFFNEVLKQADKKKWLSKEHFSVDGTLIQAWAGHKSFVRKDGKDDDDGGDFRGKSRSNETHESSTDPDSRLFCKGKTASELRFMGHTLMENRNGLIVNAMVTQADGHAEREAAKAMIADARQAMPEGEITLGADKGYDAAEFIQALQDMKVTPHVAQNTSNRKSAVPDEIAATEGYGISMQKRKLIEQGFGWAKFIGPIRQVMVRGIKKVDQVFMMAMAAYNLVRMRTLGQVRLEVAG